MTLLQMSVSGAAMTAVIALLRPLLLNRLPKRAMPVLWWAVLLRLLVPAAIPCPWNLYHLFTLARGQAALGGASLPVAVPAALPAAVQALPASGAGGALSSQSPAPAAGVPWGLVWGIGAAVCAAYYLAALCFGLKKFRGAAPLQSPAACRWMAGHPLRRGVRLRQSARVDAPLTYGVLRPVILLPQDTDWQAPALRYALEHEYIHILRWDAFTKLLLAAAVCLHWCNPLAWVFYLLFNRDMELACDETAVLRLGRGERASYANALIAMEQARSLPALYSGFGGGFRPMAERVAAVMRVRPASPASLLGAGALVLCLTTACATTPPPARQAVFTETGTGTPEPAPSHAELMAEYAPFGLTEENGKLYFNGQRVRYFLDGYSWGDSVAARYEYYSDAGTVDLHTLREDTPAADGSVQLFGPITGLEPYPQEEFDARVFPEPANASDGLTLSGEAIEGSSLTLPVNAQALEQAVRQAEEELAALLGPDAPAPDSAAYAEATRGLQPKILSLLLQQDTAAGQPPDKNGTPEQQEAWSELKAQISLLLQAYADGFRMNEDYGRLGLAYHPLDGRLYLQERTVRYLVDEARGGPLWADNEGELVVYLNRDAAGELVSLQSFPAEFTAEQAAIVSDSAEQGTSFAEFFAPYAKFGLTYEEKDGRRDLFYQGEPVAQFLDDGPGGVFSFHSTSGGSLFVHTVYGKQGDVSGLAVSPME